MTSMSFVAIIIIKVIAKKMMTNDIPWNWGNCNETMHIMGMGKKT
jgi:hypothetical protein